MSRRLAAWAVVQRGWFTVYTDPRLAEPGTPSHEASDSLADALLIPRRLKRERVAAGTERKAAP